MWYIFIIMYGCWWKSGTRESPRVVHAKMYISTVSDRNFEAGDEIKEWKKEGAHSQCGCCVVSL